MKKLYKAIEIILILLSLFIPTFMILYIWDILTETLFDRCMLTTIILWMTFLIIAVLINKIEESKKR